MLILDKCFRGVDPENVKRELGKVHTCEFVQNGVQIWMMTLSLLRKSVSTRSKFVGLRSMFSSNTLEHAPTTFIHFSSDIRSLNALPDRLTQITDKAVFKKEIKIHWSNGLIGLENFRH